MEKGKFCHYVYTSLGYVSVNLNGDRGSVVVKGLCCKVTGSRPDEVKFYIYLIIPAVLGPGVYSASNRNQYQKQKNKNVSGE
jgi:hypothetical protein